MKQNRNPIENKKTPYEWCIDKMIRITGLEQEGMESRELEFYTDYFTEKESKDYIQSLSLYDGVTVKHGRLHLKSEKYLELRMYTLVPYNLLGIQMGIQHEHSVVQNFLNNVHKSNECSRRVERWASEWKTSIVLNGGTSNEGHMVRHGFKDVWYVGSMQKYLERLEEANINYSTFYEPDLNSMLTGISFIVDERVFLRNLYKDYVETPFDIEIDGVDEESVRRWEDINDENKSRWLDKIGGEKNEFLRNFLDPKGPLKLARG